MSENEDRDLIRRARGALLGFCVGDALGAQVEFMSAAEIVEAWPSGVKEMRAGGPHELLAGQVTDDSEMMLTLTRTIADRGHYDADVAATAYVDWCVSGVPGIDPTIKAACGEPLEVFAPSKHSYANEGGAVQVAYEDFNPYAPAAQLRRRAREHSSEARGTGALMRCLPLAFVGPEHAAEEAELTHPHPTCVASVRAYVALLRALLRGDMIRAIRDAKQACGGSADAMLALYLGEERFPTDEDAARGGTGCAALQTAVHALCLPATFEEILVRVVGLGGDTDTHAALAGALLGALLGPEAIPERWVRAVLGCRSSRPEKYQPRDLDELARRLAEIGART